MAIKRSTVRLPGSVGEGPSKTQKTCGTCGPGGGRCEWLQSMMESGGRCPIGIDELSLECVYHIAYRAQRERAEREEALNVHLKGALGDVLLKLGEIGDCSTPCAEDTRDMQIIQNQCCAALGMPPIFEDTGKGV